MIRYSIALDDIEVGMKLAEDIYAFSDGIDMLIATEGTIVTERTMKFLQRHRVKKIAVLTKSKLEKYEKKEEVVEPLAPGEILPSVKPIIDEDLQEETISSAEKIFNAMREGNMTTAYQAVKDLDNALNLVVAAVTMAPDGAVHISGLKSYDEYTYHHSLSVAVLAIATGNALGLDIMELVRLSRCAMMHDCGKVMIPKEIVNKTGKLTNDEFKIMRNHAVQSALALKNNSFGDVELWTGVMFHHEKIDGKGYPKGLRGKEIPLFSRIIAVADVYDAVTSFRPYRSPMTPSDAYEVILSERGTAFDNDITDAFIKSLVLYPINTVVELSDKRIGIVIDHKNMHRPVLKLHGSEKIVDLASPENLGIVIIKVVDPNEKH